MTETNLLIASESTAARENFRASLGRIGKIATVMSWRQAEEAFSKEQFPIVIVDSKLADCSGTEFIQKMRPLARGTRHTILMTDEVTPKVLGEAQAVKASFLMIKPLMLARVEAVIRTIADLPADYQFNCEIIPGAEQSGRKVAMAFVPSKKEYDALRASLSDYDTFILPSPSLRVGVQSWGMLKPDVTFIDKELSDVRAADLVKGLRNTDKLGEIVVFAKEVDAGFLKEIGQYGVKNCLIWPLPSDAATACYSRLFAKRQVMQAEKPVEKPVEAKPTFSNVKALLVDASMEGSARAHGFLKEMKFDVTNASDLKSALAMCKQLKPGIIVSNYELSGEGSNGLELLKSIRKEDEKTPFIMTSVADCWAQIEEAQTLGCSGWLQKPFEQDELQRVVKKAMTNVRWIKEAK